MSELQRVSFSIEQPLYEKFTQIVESSQYLNRSEYIRDMIRDRVVADDLEHCSAAIAIGTLTLVYNHEQRELSQKLTRLQHEHHHMVKVATHMHLSRHMCAEMILIEGPAADVRMLANLLGQQRGVVHYSLSLSSMSNFKEDLK